MSPAAIQDRVASIDVLNAAKVRATKKVTIIENEAAPADLVPTQHYVLIRGVTNPPIFFDRNSPINMKLGAYTRLARPLPQRTVVFARDVYWQHALDTLTAQLVHLDPETYSLTPAALYGWLEETKYSEKRKYEICA